MDAGEVTDVWWSDLFRLVRVIRLFKLERVLQTNPWWQRLRLRVSGQLLTLIGGLALLFYVSHLLGCVYCTVVKNEIADASFELNAWLPPVEMLTAQADGSYSISGKT